MPTPPPIPRPDSVGLKLLNVMTDANVKLYRLSGGRLGGKFSGAPALLLDHVGRKTGRRRTTPLLYMPDGDDLIVVASRGGSDAGPAWWLNLKANPATTVQVGSERRQVVDARQHPRRSSGYGRGSSTSTPITRFTSAAPSARSR